MSDIKPTQIYYHPGTVTRDERKALLKQTGATLWFTGLSGSGKSTLAVAVEQVLIQRGHARMSWMGTTSVSVERWPQDTHGDPRLGRGTGKALRPGFQR